MSEERFTQVADLLATRLRDWPALKGAPVIVDRQHDIEQEVAEGVAKAQGLCITIFYEGFLNEDPESDYLAPTLRYTVRCWGMPAVADASGEFVPTEVASIQLAKALQGFKPEGEAKDLWRRCVVGRADVEPDNYLIYAATVTVKNVAL